MSRLDVTDKRLRLLEYKSIDFEVKSRAANLLFTGIMEQAGENCVTIVKNVLSSKMLMEDTSFTVKQAFRVGRKKINNDRAVSRPIRVTFSDSFEVKRVLSFTRNLKGTNISVNKDYPAEIADARKELWPDFKSARKVYGAKIVKMKFPAAIEIKGVVVQDKFPDWYSVLKGTRHADVKEQVSQHPALYCHLHGYGPII